MPSISVKAVAELQGYAVTHPNVTVTTRRGARRTKFSPESSSISFWISPEITNDLHDEFMGLVDIAAFNKAVYGALKPGGFYVILDSFRRSWLPRKCNRDLASHRVLDRAPERSKPRGSSSTPRARLSPIRAGPPYGQSVRPDWRFADIRTSSS